MKSSLSIFLIYMERCSACCNCVRGAGGEGRGGLKTKQLCPAYCNRHQHVEKPQQNTAARFLTWFNSLIKLNSPQVSKCIFIKVPLVFIDLFTGKWKTFSAH